MMQDPLHVSPDFIENLKSLYPKRDGDTRNLLDLNPWYIIAAVGFSASNRPEGVPLVFQYALEDLRRQYGGEDLAKLTKVLAQKLKEVIFKSGLVSGYSKVINALQALDKAIPDDLRANEIQRYVMIVSESDTEMSLGNYEQKGLNVFRTLYGETADAVDGLLSSIYPDMGWFSRTIAYGLVYGHADTVTPLETSYTLVAALIAADTPQQIGWHLAGARRGGATVEEVKAIRQMSIEVARLSGTQWRHSVPEVNF